MHIYTLHYASSNGYSCLICIIYILSFYTSILLLTLNRTCCLHCNNEQLSRPIILLLVQKEISCFQLRDNFAHAQSFDRYVVQTCSFEWKFAILYKKVLWQYQKIQVMFFAVLVIRSTNIQYRYINLQFEVFNNIKRCSSTFLHYSHC